MSGSAGLSPSGNPKPEGSALSGYARNLKKECGGLVAGQASSPPKLHGIRKLSLLSFKCNWLNENRVFVRDRSATSAPLWLWHLCIECGYVLCSYIAH